MPGRRSSAPRNRSSSCAATPRSAWPRSARQPMCPRAASTTSSNPRKRSRWPSSTSTGPSRSGPGRRILTGEAEPLTRLRQLFEATEAAQLAGQQSCGTVSGCLFGNLTLEMSNHTEAVRKRLQEIFEAQVDMVAPVIAAALARNEISVPDPREAARSVVAQLEGQVLFAKLYNNTATARSPCGRTAWRCSGRRLRARPCPADATPACRRSSWWQAPAGTDVA